MKEEQPKNTPFREAASRRAQESSGWLKQKEKIIKQFQERGVNITADSDLFTLNLKDKNDKPYQVKIQAWKTIAVIMNPKDQSSVAIQVDIERIIETEVSFAREYESGKERPSMKELLDRFAPEKESRK